ncbi:MAG: helix-turn-helix domain-containing protein [Nitrososphaeria archaeon]
MITRGTVPSYSEIELLLKDYGLSERQIKIYLLLLATGPMKLSELSYKAGLYRMQVYNTLKQLIQMGLVEAILKRPITYIAVSPKKALNLLLEETSERLERAKERQAFLLEQLMSLSKVATVAYPVPKFKIIQGRKQFIKMAKESYRRAKYEVNNINTPSAIIRGIMAGFDEVAEECAKRGVKIRWLTDVSAQNLNGIKKYCEYGEIRFVPLESSIRILIVDGLEIYISSLYDESIALKTEGETTIYIYDLNIASFMNKCFNYLWSLAKPIHP